jgi:4'-phosphopantetheinyl transferase EntD
MLPPWVAFAEVDFADREDPDLFAEEAERVARAVERRRSEYAWGRQLARDTLRSLGAEVRGIPSGPDRLPLWPPGYVASITHSRTYCACAAARASDTPGIGIDVEFIEPRKRNDWYTRVCFDDELEWCESNPDLHLERIFSVFSAKEAFYKAQYLVTRRFLGFGDVRVVFEGDEFEITPRVADLGLQATIRGFRRLEGNRVFSVVILGK